LLEYLLGRGLMAPDGESLALSDRGRVYWNYVTRGVLMAHLGGYNPMLTRLGPLLRREIDLNDPSLDRDGRLVAIGSGCSLLGNGTITWIQREVRRLGGRYVLDLGCGAGDFLIQLALRWQDGGGAGIDMSAEAIAAARQSAAAHGVADRLVFCEARLSEKPMELPDHVLDRVDTLTAMYMLHEFAGDGGIERITSMLASLRKQFPGRKLLMAEGARADALEANARPPRTYAQLDYSFIHPLSRQGPLRTPEEWEQIIETAGARLLERIPGFNMIPAWISLYVIGFD
jgi:SAM-dependent methyltransferase